LVPCRKFPGDKIGDRDTGFGIRDPGLGTRQTPNPDSPIACPVVTSSDGGEDEGYFGTVRRRFESCPGVSQAAQG
jgi:hypothetical protein